MMDIQGFQGHLVCIQGFQGFQGLADTLDIYDLLSFTLGNFDLSSKHQMRSNLEIECRVQKRVLS